MKAYDPLICCYILKEKITIYSVCVSVLHTWLLMTSLELMRVPTLCHCLRVCMCACMCHLMLA